MRNPTLALTHHEAKKDQLLAFARTIPGAWIGIKIAALLLLIEGQRPGWISEVLGLTRMSLSRWIHAVNLYVDQARWHKGDSVDHFLISHRRLHLEYLPAYQPGLNMQERIWRQVRYEATTNRWFEELDLIWHTIRKTTRSWSPVKIRRLCNVT
jgi:hypothetical protein